MADHFIGINRGTDVYTEKSYTYGTSTGATDVEVRIADAAGWTRDELYQALEAIADRLVANDSPAAASKFPVL